MKEFKVMRTRRRRSSFTSRKRRNYGFKTRRRYHSNHRVAVSVAMTLCAVVLVGSVCALCLKFLSYEQTVAPSTTIVTDSCVIENEKTSTLILKNGDISVLEVSVDEEAQPSLEFQSSDPEIVSVDSGGRIDAKKEGVAVVTASTFGFSGSCEVTVEKASEDPDSKEITTAITTNSDIVAKNRKDKTKNLYSIKVNRRTNIVTVYTYDEKGRYVVPVRTMVASCGEFTDENITPTGKYSVYFKSRWHPLFGDVYGQYVTGFSGVYLFHSVPYKTTSADSLKTDEFNKLGTNASQGCVRLMVSDSKWIYDNVDMNTDVEVIDKKENDDLIDTPHAVKITEKPYWDPTDPSSKNPYKDKVPVIKGAKDITVKKDSDFDSKVTAKDSCGNDITDRIVTTGNVITSKPGKYLVTYEVTDDFHKTAEVTVTVTVE